MKVLRLLAITTGNSWTTLSGLKDTSIDFVRFMLIKELKREPYETLLSGIKMSLPLMEMNCRKECCPTR